jgi:hypothetical protein
MKPETCTLDGVYRDFIGNDSSIPIKTKDFKKIHLTALSAHIICFVSRINLKIFEFALNVLTSIDLI